MSDRGPLTPAGLRVCDRMCSTCIFRPGNLMMLRPGRLRGMIAESLEKDGAIPCHKTLEGDKAVCRGFYDRYATDTLLCRFGAIVGVIAANPDDYDSLTSRVKSPLDGDGS